MAKTYSQIVSDSSNLLQDSSNTVFLAAEFDVIMPQGLERISEAKPWQYKLTKTTTAASRDITLSAGDKWRLVGIDRLEFLIDKNRRQRRRYARFGDVITIGRDTLPTGESIYLYLNKVHLLQSALGTADTAGEVDLLQAAGSVTLKIKSLTTGTINEMSTVAIAGDSTVYYVTATATIATNAATVSIWPPLAATASGDAAVTLSLTGSTLDMKLERLLAWWLAATAAISKSTLSYAQVNTAITTIANAATAIAAIAARITQAVADAASGRTQATNAATAITLANTEFDKIVTQVDLAVTALASGASLINTVTVGGGAGEYMGQASADLGVSQGRMANGQVYLQEASADHANAAQYFNAAAAELRAAGEKAQEANSNLSLVATRLRVSDGGRNYEAWGRAELAKVEKELDSMNNYPHSTNYARD